MGINTKTITTTSVEPPRITLAKRLNKEEQIAVAKILETREWSPSKFIEDAIKSYSLYPKLDSSDLNLERPVPKPNPSVWFWAMTAYISGILSVIIYSL